MSLHLTSEQMSAVVLGNAARDVDAHLRGCVVCQAEVRRWENDLSAFGSAVRNWSEQEAMAVPVRRERERHAAFPKPLSVLAVCASILICCVVAEFHRFSARELPRSVAPPNAELSDTVLMRDVDTELSRSVPGPMEPLSNPSLSR